MTTALISRLILSRLTSGFIMGAQMLGWVTIGRASNAASTFGAGAPPPAPDEARQALRELGQFLDRHASLEDELRLDPRRISDPGYLKKNPRLREFLQVNPAAAAGVDLDPLYFLDRELLRQARAPVSAPNHR